MEPHRRWHLCLATALLVERPLPTAKWHDYIGDPMVADAVCDRLLNNAHRLVLKGPSRRKESSESDK
jgi:DNA replication protein DnaC